MKTAYAQPDPSRQFTQMVMEEIAWQAHQQHSVAIKRGIAAKRQSTTHNPKEQQ